MMTCIAGVFRKRFPVVATDNARVSNVKNQYLQIDLLIAVICSHQNTAIVAVNSIASLGWKSIEIP